MGVMPKKPSSAERRMATLFEEEALQNRQKWVAKHALPGTLFVRQSGWDNPGAAFTATPKRQFIKEHLCVLIGWRHILDKNIVTDILDPANFEAVMLSPIVGLCVVVWKDFDEFKYRVFDASWKDRS